MDPLTGLLNRRGFRAALHHLVDSVRGDVSTYLVLLDLDNLKQVNDVHGHPAGDEALRAFADRLSRGARGGDIVARLGGDEFAVAGGASPHEATSNCAGWRRLPSAGGKPEDQLRGLEGNVELRAMADALELDPVSVR